MTIIDLRSEEAIKKTRQLAKRQRISGLPAWKIRFRDKFMKGICKTNPADCHGCGDDYRTLTKIERFIEQELDMLKKRVAFVSRMRK